MKGIRFICFLCGLGLFFSCSKGVEEKMPFISLKSQILKTDSLLIGHKVIAKMDSFLIFPTWKCKTLYDIYAIKGDSLIFQNHFLPFGNGPYELTMSVEAYSLNNGCFLTYDPNIQKGFQINLKNRHDMLNKSTYKEFKQLQRDLHFLKIVYETDSTLVTTFLQNGIRSYLGRFNLNSGFLTPIWGLWPNDGFEGADNIKQQAYAVNGILLKHPFLNKYFTASGVGKYGEIFSIQEDSIISHHKLFDIYPKYKADDDGMNIKYDRSNFSGLDACVSSNYIYVMPDRGTTGDYLSNNHPSSYYIYTNEVFVYDWDGVLRKKYLLDKDILTLFVDNEDRAIWGLVMDEKTNDEYMVRYDLK